MRNSLYIVASEERISTVWQKIIESLSMHGVIWSVDCLDCMYETNLKEGTYSLDRLLTALKDNTCILSARMISCLDGQTLDKRIITLDDFYSSNCESIVLCADGKHFELFSKCEDLLLRVSTSFAEGEVERLEWEDVASCGRSEFTV